MKKLIAIALLCGAPSFLTAATAEKPALVDTAKDAKAKRKKSSTKVITNADVKKSKGKLIVLDTATAEPAPKPAAKATLVQHDERYKARLAAVDHVIASEKKVADLEKDLERIEQRYYEENDPNYRDTVLQQRFAQTKRQLEDARQQLADARDALTTIEAPVQ